MIIDIPQHRRDAYDGAFAEGLRIHLKDKGIDNKYWAIFTVGDEWLSDIELWKKLRFNPLYALYNKEEEIQIDKVGLFILSHLMLPPEFVGKEDKTKPGYIGNFIYHPFTNTLHYMQKSGVLMNFYIDNDFNTNCLKLSLWQRVKEFFGFDVYLRPDQISWLFNYMH